MGTSLPPSDSAVKTLRTSRPEATFAGLDSRKHCLATAVSDL